MEDHEYPDPQERTELVAELMWDGWCVRDPDGGVWWPGEEACVLIAGACDPRAKALELCLGHPGSGYWHC